MGLLRLELFIEDAKSLKDKRQVVKSVIGKVESKYNVSVSEVGHQELWQRAVIGIAHVSETEGQTRKLLQSVRDFVESLEKAVVAWGELSIFAPDS